MSSRSDPGTDGGCSDQVIAMEEAGGDLIGAACMWGAHRTPGGRVG